MSVSSDKPKPPFCVVSVTLQNLCQKLRTPCHESMNRHSGQLRRRVPGGHLHAGRAHAPRGRRGPSDAQRLQLAMRERFSAAVEEIMERKVIAFMSQVHFEPDLAAEVSVLQPNGD